jgi:sugar phosphate isomerase/epimerase
MKTCVSSYSFSQLVGSGKMAQIDVAKEAKQMGFDYVEFSALKLSPGETPLSFAPRLKEECERVGIPVASYTIGADFLNGSGGDWQKEAERLRDEVRVAQILGAPCMRHDATRGWPGTRKTARSFDDALPILSKACRAVTEFAAGLGVKTMVENHGFFAQDSVRVEKLMNAVDHPNFGALVDMGNFLCADDPPAEAVARMAPYAFHAHAKDFHVKPGWAPNPGKGWFQSRAGNYLRGAIIGHGDVPVMQCLRALKRGGYDGIVSIEFEGLEDPRQGIALGLDNLQRYMKEVG